MLSKAQIMQIGVVTKNPALVARMMKDYKSRQPRRLPEVLVKHLANSIYSYHETSEGWRVERFVLKRHCNNAYLVEYYDNDGLSHRTDGPAVIWGLWTTWCYHGLVHRVAGPAIEISDTAKHPYSLYLRHSRINSTVAFLPGAKAWVRYGRLHRLEAPAIIDRKKEEWWEDGRLHRMSGPAIKCFDGSEYWYQNGKVHRQNGPARIFKNHSKEWWHRGFRHRSDAPAIEYEDGREEWWNAGKLHNTNGPAVICAFARKRYFIFGKEFTEEEFDELKCADAK